MKKFVIQDKSGLVYHHIGNDIGGWQPAWGPQNEATVTVVENYDQEIVAEEAKKAERKDRIEVLRGLKGKNLSNAEIQLVMQTWIREMTGD